jgi:nitrite reductase/ring-hydroxylating ferredoxin subunit
MEDEKIGRRSFLERSGVFTLGSLAVGALVPVSGNGVADTQGGSASSDYTIRLDDPANAPLKNTGGAQKFKIPGQSQTVIVIRKSEKEVVAFSSRCPHRGHEVNLPRGNAITCPAHRSAFDLSGKRVSGPAPAGSKLSVVPSKLTGSQILLTLP